MRSEAVSDCSEQCDCSAIVVLLIEKLGDS